MAPVLVILKQRNIVPGNSGSRVVEIEVDNGFLCLSPHRHRRFPTVEVLHNLTGFIPPVFEERFLRGIETIVKGDDLLIFLTGDLGVIRIPMIVSRLEEIVVRNGEERALQRWWCGSILRGF